jgi:hypothetical protein
MALYIPASRRRRRVIIAAVVALLVGLLVGFLVTRLTTPSIDDQVSSKQRDAEQLIARLDGLKLEYQQAGQSGAGGADAREGAVDAARGISADTRRLVADLPWLSEQQRAQVTAAVDGVGQVVAAGGSPAAVAVAVTRAEAALRDAAGLPPAAS